jgi:23S rRNA (guanosine2251-2'-O)-methyltransferase
MDDGAALDYLGEIANPLLLVLDSIEDPRNYGACLRTAEGAGVDLVVSGRSRGVDVTPVVSKVASGAAETQPIARVSNLARFMRELQNLNIWIVGTDDSGPATLYESNLTGPLAIVMGAEGKGLRRLTREHCDSLVRIPMRGSVDSLNISVAAGVCLYEALRQRG